MKYQIFILGMVIFFFFGSMISVNNTWSQTSDYKATVVIDKKDDSLKLLEKKEKEQDRKIKSMLAKPDSTISTLKIIPKIADAIDEELDDTYSNIKYSERKVKSNKAEQVEKSEQDDRADSQSDVDANPLTPIEPYQEAKPDSVIFDDYVARPENPSEKPRKINIFKRISNLFR